MRKIQEKGVQEAPDGEVLVLRHDDGADRSRVIPDAVIWGGGNAEIHDMLGDMSPRLQPSRQCGGSCASTRKRTSLGAPQNGMVILASGELQDRRDVLVLEVRVIGQDLVSRGARRKEVEHVLDAHPHASDARTSSAHRRVDRDPVHCTHGVFPGTVDSAPILADRRPADSDSASGLCGTAAHRR